MQCFRLIKISLLLFFFNSCEKDIKITPIVQAPKLVVDAQIEYNQPPIIVLSNSLNYFSVLDSTDLVNSIINNAKVVINDGTKSIQLKYYDVSVVNGYQLGFYSNDRSNSSEKIIGELGKTYQLTIELDGNTYKSATTIPYPTKTIDSIWYRRVPNRPANDSFVILSAKIFDPPGLGNYIRYFTKINSKDFYPGFNSVYDDNVVDGKTYNVDLPKGVNKNELLVRENQGFFKKGDTISVKFCNINKSTYEFWRTWEYTFQSVGNPFASPGVVIGNISNGGLGAFCGYAVQYKNIIIPK